VQPRAVDDDQRRAGPGLDRGLVDGEERAAVAVAQPTTRGQGRRALADGPAEAERVEGADAVGHQPDPRAGLAQLRAAFQHRHPMTRAVQCHARGQAAQARSDHDDVHAASSTLYTCRGRLASEPLQK